jgi:hypothetical protein
VASAVGLIVSLIDYFTPHGAIAHDVGTLFVIVSTALMLMASLLLSLTAMPRWLIVLFQVLVILDVLGTGFCAYMLEAPILLAFMIVALIGWIVLIAYDRPRVAR